MATQEIGDQTDILTSRVLQTWQTLADMLDLLVAAIPEAIDVR